MSLSQPTHDIRVLYDLKARMRDDTKLSNDVFLPRQPGRFPTILLRTPYETLHEPHIDWAVWWAKRGYAVVLQVRNIDAVYGSYQAACWTTGTCTSPSRASVFSPCQ